MHIGIYIYIYVPILNPRQRHHPLLLSGPMIHLEERALRLGDDPVVHGPEGFPEPRDVLGRDKYGDLEGYALESGRRGCHCM